jgi:hypothetical protein
MHRVTLQDGTVLDGLTLNGNNYISDTIIDSDVFADNLATVEIYDGEQVHLYQDMKLVANQLHDGKSWFILAEKTVDEKERERVNQEIDRLKTVIVIDADKIQILADGIDAATVTATIPLEAEYCFVTVNGPPAERAEIVNGQVVREFTSTTVGIFRVDFYAANRVATVFIEAVE